MDALYTYLLQAAAGSGILLGAYILLLEKRASFRVCRIYLLTAILLTTVIPLLKIPVWSVPAVQIVMQAEVVMPVATTILADETAPIPWPGIIAAVWAVGILILVGSMLRQVVKIYILRHRAHRSSTPGYTIAYTQEQIGSFSFLHTVYLWEGTPQAHQRHIIAHEASHILHRHTCERLIMEGLKALLWWNPFVWIASRKLVEAHEFEADRDVLDAGCPASAYADTIFGQLFGYNPDITNGLHDSLTKKRLQMMTTNTKCRHSLLRLAATLPAIAGLLCAFSFTTRAAEMMPQPEEQPQPLVLIDHVEVSPDSLQKLDPEMIVSVSVIKDANATAKYGSRGSNGVIEVTTKLKRERTDLSKADTLVSRITIQGAPDLNGNEVHPRTDQVITVQGKKEGSDEPFLVVEQMPLFQGGQLKNFMDWVQAQIKDTKGDTVGRIIATFVIEKDGSLSSIEILQTPDEVLNNEVIRILKKSPKWTPGMQRGQAVRVKYTMPIYFNTQEGLK